MFFGAAVDKYFFGRVFTKALDDTAKPQMIINSFRSCGVWPVDFSAIKVSRMAPSQIFEPYSVMPNTFSTHCHNEMPLQEFVEMENQEMMENQEVMGSQAISANQGMDKNQEIYGNQGMNQIQVINENQGIEQVIEKEAHFDFMSIVNDLETESYTTLLYGPDHIFPEDSTTPSTSYSQTDIRNSTLRPQTSESSEAEPQTSRFFETQTSVDVSPTTRIFNNSTPTESRSKLLFKGN